MPKTISLFFCITFLIFSIPSSISCQECVTGAKFEEIKQSLQKQQEYVINNVQHLNTQEIKEKLGQKIKHLNDGSFGSVYEYFSPLGNKTAVKFLKKKTETKQYDFKLLFLELNANSCMLNAVDEIPSFDPYFALIKNVYYDTQLDILITVMILMDDDLLDWTNEYINKPYSSLSTQLQLTIDNIIYVLAKEINFMHKNNMVHRDLKLENIMLKNMIPVVGDFGLAITKTSWSQEIVGTKVYMDPNLINTGQGDTKSDVYSLGIIYYILLNGINSINVVNNMVKIGKNQFNGEFTPNVSLLKFPEKYKELENMVSINPQNRPSMEDVMNYLKDIKDQEEQRHAKLQLQDQQYYNSKLQQQLSQQIIAKKKQQEIYQNNQYFQVQNNNKKPNYQSLRGNQPVKKPVIIENINFMDPRQMALMNKQKAQQTNIQLFI